MLSTGKETGPRTVTSQERILEVNDRQEASVPPLVRELVDVLISRGLITMAVLAG